MSLPGAGRSSFIRATLDVNIPQLGYWHCINKSGAFVLRGVLNYCINKCRWNVSIYPGSDGCTAARKKGVVNMSTANISTFKARHEACHAVMSVVLGVPLGAVVGVAEGDECGGYCSGRSHAHKMIRAAGATLGGSSGVDYSYVRSFCVREYAVNDEMMHISGDGAHALINDSEREALDVACVYGAPIGAGGVVAEYCDSLEGVIDVFCQKLIRNRGRCNAKQAQKFIEKRLTKSGVRRVREYMAAQAAQLATGIEQ